MLSEMTALCIEPTQPVVYLIPILPTPTTPLRVRAQTVTIQPPTGTRSIQAQA